VRRLLILGAIIFAAGVGVAIAVASSRTSGAAARSGSATVSVKKFAGHGKVLVDAKGRPLYRNAQERKGMILCKGACVSFWKPLIVRGKPTRSSSAVGRLGTVRRPDGRRQVTDNGRLLYTFTLDKRGKVAGDGFKDEFGGQRFTWHVVRPAGAKSSSGSTTTPTYTYSY
jgi:predicted lipoprotein with Yx(FWY)xxD motif